MRRRRYLALVGAGLLAGCGSAGSSAETDDQSGPAATATASSTPAATATPTPTATPTQTPTPTPPSVRERFETVVGEAVAVRQLAVRETLAVLEYQTTATTSDEQAEEIGAVAGAYAGAIDQGWDIDRMEVGIYAGDEAIGDYYIETAWVRSHLAEEITREEYVRRVLETVEVYD